MEHCPNCGSDVRVGSKFCTICGHRFVDPATNPGAAPVTEDAALSRTEEQDELAEHAVAAWPSPPGQLTPPEDWTWRPAPPPVAAAPVQREVDDLTSPISEPSDLWTASTSTAEEQTGPAAPTTQTTSDQSDEAVSSAVALVDQVSELLVELRQVITAGPESIGRDLSGVISELEVAITPPGAIPQDDLATLREALFAARERPRDLDTVVDLTSRIDALVALVIAYDRTTAAIERALAVLRRPDATQSP